MKFQENKKPQIVIILLQEKNNASTELCQNDGSVFEGSIKKNIVRRTLKYALVGERIGG